MMDTLLPCPFCGGINLLVCDPDRWAGEHYWHVDCQNQECGIEGPYDLGESGAIAKWNSRSAPAAPRESCIRYDADDAPDALEDC